MKTKIKILMLNIISLLFMLIILEIVLRAINSSGRNQDEKLNQLYIMIKLLKIIDQILFLLENLV